MSETELLSKAEALKAVRHNVDAYAHRVGFDAGWDACAPWADAMAAALRSWLGHHRHGCECRSCDLLRRWKEARE